MSGGVYALYGTMRRVLIGGGLVLSVCASIVLLTPEGLNLLSGEIILLSLLALWTAALEVSVVTLRGFLGSEVLCNSGPVSDLNAGIARIAAIASGIAASAFIVVIVNHNGFANDFFQGLVVVAGLPTPFYELLETGWLDFLTSTLPVTECAEESIVISICVSDPCNDGKLYTPG